MKQIDSNEDLPQREWWKLPIRMMREDYAPDFSQVKNIDFEALVKDRINGWHVNCEWILGAPGYKDATHLTTFTADGYGRVSGFEDFDYLKEYALAAHKYGLRVISYLNAHFYSYKFAAEHPGWEQITCRGVAYGVETPLYGHATTFCINSPWRDWAFGLIREAMKTGIDGVFLDGPVIFPDSCYCSHCQAKFREEYGAEIPQEDWENPLWKKFIAFREDCLGEFLRDAQQTVKDVNPEGIVFLNAGSWQPTGWRVARDVLKVEPFQDFNGSEAFYYYDVTSGLYDSLMTGKYLRGGHNPSVLFTHYMNGLWHYLLLPPKELELALVQTSAVGANPWIAFIHSALQSHPNGKEPVNKIFGFMAKNEKYFIDAESSADVAILFSSNTARFYLTQHEEFSAGGQKEKEENLIVKRGEQRGQDLSSRKRDCEEFLYTSRKGYFKAFTRSHVPFDIILDPDVTKEVLSKYKTLVLPDATCFSKETADVIREYVAGGGNLMSTFEGGLYDENGDPSDDLLDVLGIKEIVGQFTVTNGENYLHSCEDHLGFHQDCLITRAPYVMKINATDDSKVLELVLNPVTGDYLPLNGISPYPGLITHHYGKGKVAYFSEALGPFSDVGLTAAEDRLCKMVTELSGGFDLELEAPRTVSVEYYRQKDANRIIIHIVNNTVDGRPVREFLPVNDISMKLRSTQKPNKVFSLREGEDLKTSYIDGAININIPKLSLYEVVVVEF